MTLRDHRTRKDLQTWHTHHASEPRHARWAARRADRATTKHKGVEKAQEKRERKYHDDQE